MIKICITIYSNIHIFVDLFYLYLYNTGIQKCLQMLSNKLNKLVANVIFFVGALWNCDEIINIQTDYVNHFHFG